MWTGTFKSEAYPRVLGLVPLVEGTLATPRVDVDVGTVTGLYRSGGSVALAVHKTRSGTWRARVGAQSLEFRFDKQSDTWICGTYVSTAPADHGTFHLTHAAKSGLT